MNTFSYDTFYDRIGKLIGWDFSRIQMTTEGALWDYHQKAASLASDNDLLLDIGTGGGESALAMAQHVQLLIGIDRSPDMIETARQRLAHFTQTNARFFTMDADELQFPSGMFDLVTCRHAPFQAEEVARVLKANGCFVTQQVAEQDKENLKKWFGRGQSYLQDNGITLLEESSVRLREAGFQDIQVYEYDAVEYYKTAQDLFFLLAHTPTIPLFGQVDGDMERFDSFVKEHTSEKGIRTNASRFLIVATR